MVEHWGDKSGNFNIKQTTEKHIKLQQVEKLVQHKTGLTLGLVDLHHITQQHSGLDLINRDNL